MEEKTINYESTKWNNKQIMSYLEENNDVAEEFYSILCDLDLIQNEFEEEKQKYLNSVDVQQMYKGVPNSIYQEVLLELTVNQTKSVCFTNDVMEAFEKGDRICVYKYFEENIHMLETKTKALKKMGIDNDQIKSIVDSTIKNYRHQLDLISVEIKNQKDIDYKMLKTNTPKEKVKRQIEKD